MLLWMFIEFFRPPNPLKLPLLISVASLAGWAVRREKQWRPQSWGFLAFVGVMCLSGLLAANSFAAFSSTRDMVIRLVCIAIPLQSLVTSIDRFRWILVALLVSTFGVGVWATTHGGMGPAGPWGGQDENYVAALMGMGIPLAYFSIFVEKSKAAKIFLIGCLLVFVAAIGLANNPSRGGFLGLVAVTLYCLARSPKKVAGFTVVGIGAAVMVAVAGPTFWDEIRTTTDVNSGTADIRLEIWKMGLRMWAANPITGVGGGNFRWVLDDYQSAEQFEKFGRSFGGSIYAHSLPIELMAELGTAGLLVLAYLVWRTWKELGKVRDRSLELTKVPGASPDHHRLRCYADAMRASILAVMVNGVFLSLLYYSHIWVLIAMGSVFPLLLASELGENREPPEPQVISHPRSTRAPPNASRSTARTPRHTVVLPYESPVNETPE